MAGLYGKVKKAVSSYSAGRRKKLTGSPKKITGKGILTARQKTTLANHKKHHTPKHMAEMRRLMKAGKTFTAAHKAAMKKVGK